MSNWFDERIPFQAVNTTCFSVDVNWSYFLFSKIGNYYVNFFNTAGKKGFTLPLQQFDALHE